MTLSLVGNRLVTAVMASDSRNGLRFLGYCSTDITTGLSVFRSHDDMMPSDWFVPIGLLSSDAKHFYISGFTNPDMNLGVTPTTLPYTYGIYEYDAATLTPGSHVTYSGQSPDGYPEGLLLTERPPS